MDTKEIAKIVITIVFLILIFALPMIGIFALWDFEPQKIVNSITSSFNGSSKENDYNFSIPAAEDELLTASLIDEQTGISIVSDKNPAILIRIKKADIEGPIVYGQDGETLLREGFWHHPSSVFPGESGTSTIFGHRRYHLPPAKDTFYNLDKVKLGDMIEVKLKDGTWLEYNVIDAEVVLPEDLNAIVTANAENSQIKLITCTPLGSSEKRLVITAERVV